MPAVVSVNDFPDICKVIYEEKVSVANLSELYIQELRKKAFMSSSNSIALYANKLEERSNMLQPKKLKELERDFYYFKEYMRKNCKIPFSVKYRQKNFIRYNDKIRCLLVKGESLDRIRDLLGIRIILSSPSRDNLEFVRQCYQILEHVIYFFVVKRGGIPLNVIDKVLPDEAFHATEHPEIVIPKKDYWSQKAFSESIKDYIMYPRGEGGYQSLHIVIKMKNDVTVEFQIRTFAMDVSAEEGSASHSKYAKKRHEKTDIILDYSKIQLPGFVYLVDPKDSKNNKIYDTSGLTKHINPFNIF